ncbi:hypothetical protein BV22DRAFT_1133908 [Leucogyrophana mollusca]|uniref:Uncharacterized protein n=1 Tax=Leucogyrophana mollusca TaxID=85980 RepID=A0ACB8B2B2_9AGAM|nr:hypothetical protein BV22DRAFT_1133908 [Leucogyrophana mollusca]
MLTDPYAKSHSFLSSLLPPTPETTAHVRAQGGALPHTITNAPTHLPSLPEDSHILSSHSASRSPRLSSPVVKLTTQALALAVGLSSCCFYTPSRIRLLYTTIHTPDPRFTILLAQTHSYLLSPDFAAPSRPRSTVRRRCSSRG